MKNGSLYTERMPRGRDDVEFYEDNTIGAESWSFSPRRDVKGEKHRKFSFGQNRRVLGEAFDIVQQSRKKLHVT